MQLNPVVRRKALRTFRQRGVVVHVGALEHLFAVFENLPDIEFPEFLDSIFDILGRSDGAAEGILTREVAESIAKRLQRDSDRKFGVAAATAEVIDIFSVPSWEPAGSGTANAYFAGKRVEAPSRPVIDALAPEKANMLRLRYELMRGKTLRNEKFTPPASGMLSAANASPYFRLTGIESLPGSKDERLVLGMLTQLEEGSWFLEDLNGVVRVDLSQASVTAGLHTECSFVIAQGRFVEEDGEEPYFHVSAMGTPPLERREQSLNAMSKNPNMFGGQMEVTESAALFRMEKEAVDSVFLLLSDVALDNSKVIAGLRHIFQGYLEDGVLPKIIVLMGNFLSHPFGQVVSDITTLAEKFTELGKMIRSAFAALADECMFVVVPGTNDPGPGNVLPRPPMPKIVMKGFIEAIGAERVHLGTNPCRIRYLTQEIVLLRDDLMQKMVRHCAVKPDFGESGLMSEHFVKSVVDQSNLCPLPNSARPVLWRHAHAMWLFPTPHAVILADRVDGYICKYGGTLGLNPGSFATDFSFQVYLPAERRAQLCSLDSEQIDAGKEVTGDKVDDSGREHTAAQLSDMEMDGGESDLDEDIVPLAQPRREVQEQQKITKTSPDDSSGLGDLAVAENSTPFRELDADSLSRRNVESESDDDSMLVPADGVEKRDIKALLRESAAHESDPASTDGAQSSILINNAR